MTAKAIIKGVLLILAFAAAGLLLKQSDIGAMLDEQWLDAHVRGEGMMGRALFVLLAGLLAGIGLPRQAVSFAGGYAFGLVEGTGLALCGTILGCVGSFSFARFFGRDYIAGKLSERVRRVDGFLSDHPFSMALLIRLLPAGSNLLTSLAAGVSSAPALPFFAGSALGFIPQTFIFALAGTGTSIDPAMRIGLSVVLFLVSALLGVYLYRRYRRGRSAGEEIDRALEQ
ncbi:MAG: TVP38/TMEM64 family protein [Rhodospirillales bacterium]|nr:TVP38/TMEM64 family protein [Rhodospirillales bacterium]